MIPFHEALPVLLLALAIVLIPLIRDEPPDGKGE